MSSQRHSHSDIGDGPEGGGRGASGGKGEIGKEERERDDYYMGGLTAQTTTTLHDGNARADLFLRGVEEGGSGVDKVACGLRHPRFGSGLAGDKVTSSFVDHERLSPLPRFSLPCMYGRMIEKEEEEEAAICV